MAVPTLGHRFILKEILFICCGLLVLVFVVQADYEDSDYYEDDYGDDYGDIDMCDYHGTTMYSCHKDNLPKETMEDLFGKNVKKCCKVHGYEETISEDCKVRSKLIF